MTVSGIGVTVSGIFFKGDGALGSGGRSKHQRCVLGDRVPPKTCMPSFAMDTEVAVKVVMQPWSQSCPMEIKDPVASLGKMWAWQAESGREGMSKVAVWLDWMVLPSGRSTVMLGLAGIFCRTGAELVRKCPVQPVSAMSMDDWAEGGGAGVAGTAGGTGVLQGLGGSEGKGGEELGAREIGGVERMFG